MRIMVCSYRDWVDPVLKDLACWDRRYEFIGNLTHITTPEHLEKYAREKHWDVIVLIGWSWKVPADIVESKLVIGMHPSDLPKYAGGSPVQNQILDGLTESKATLFKLNAEFDKGEIIDKEPINLEGHLVDVFSSIAAATSKLLFRFIESYPNYKLSPQNHDEGFVVRRLKPEQSKIPNPLWFSPDGSPMSCRAMWNHIRCREDPYPNAFFQDETGKLVIKHVEFIPNDPTDD
jgi:methionyl-tRNA formyltransferase